MTRSSLRPLVAALTLTLALTACDAGSGTAGTGTGTAPPMPANASIQISFDEVSETTATSWPGDVAARADASTELLLRYAHTREVTRFSAEGGYSRTVEYVDGDASTWYPPEFASAVEANVPDPLDPDPTKRYEIANGQVTIYGVSGAVKGQVNLNGDVFQVSSEMVELMRRSPDATADEPTDRTEESLELLRQSGMSFRTVQDDLVEIEREDPDSGYTEQTLLNLRSGLPRMVTSVRPDGRRESVEIRSYQRAGGLMLPIETVTFSYGDVNGAWGVTSKTQVTRTNLAVTTG